MSLPEKLSLPLSPAECRNGLLEEAKAASMTNRTKTNPCAELVTPGPRALGHSALPASLAWTEGFKPHSRIRCTLALFISLPQGEIWRDLLRGQHRVRLRVHGRPRDHILHLLQKESPGLASRLLLSSSRRPRLALNTLQRQAFALVVPSAWNTLT